MGSIFYSNSNEDQTITGTLPFKQSDADRNVTLYHYYLFNPNKIVFVRSIKIDDSDSNIRVCLTTIENESICFYKTENNLALNQIKEITVQTKFPDNSEILKASDSTSNFVPIDDSLQQDLDPSSSQGNGEDSTLPSNTGPEQNNSSEPNNDDKSKDETSLWMFLTNNLWLLIIIGIVIIISVYVYITFQERTEAYKTSIFGNGTFTN